jgi:type II secretory pathway pseudopilin PulG
MNLKTNHSGQVALIMVLIMTVVSAVAVSMASRSTVETRIQQMNVENTEAILTAQAGLEESLTQNAAVTGTFGEGNSYAVTTADTGSDSITTERINSGESFEVNLVGSVGVTGIKIYWRAATSAGTPAIYVSDIRASNYVDYAYDTNASNGFTLAGTGGTLQGVDYSYSTPVLNIVSGDSQKFRITVLQSAAYLGIQPIGGLLPNQFTILRSVADVASSDQNVVRYGIEYVESKTNQLPSVFDYVLFSGGSIIQ